MLLPTAYVQEISEYRIAFASDIGGHWEIYLMDVSSRNRINLANSKRADYYPSAHTAIIEWREVKDEQRGKQTNKEVMTGADTYQFHISLD